MTEAQLRQAFEAEKPALAAWGGFVAETIVDALRAELGESRPVNYFLKLWPVVPRIKETKSFIEKALWRNRRYTSPLSEITDKVGVRFVVLLLDEIRLIERIIQTNSAWEPELSRDFLQERQAKPLHFDYQSLHYVVKSHREFVWHSVIVPSGTSCEIQVRTLLQHAYSELTHDTLYKPRSILETDDASLSRQVARSMALIETSDLIFQQVAGAIEQATAELKSALRAAENVYREKIGAPKAVEIRLAEFILAPFRMSLPLVDESTLTTLLDDQKHLIAFVRDAMKMSLFFETGLVLIIFWLINEDEDAVWRNWPVDRKILEQIYAQLGLSTERY